MTTEAQKWLTKVPEEHTNYNITVIHIMQADYMSQKTLPKTVKMLFLNSRYKNTVT
jgi:hypothetical protein